MPQRSSTRFTEFPEASLDTEIDADWYDTVTVVDCGENLTKSGGPGCGAATSLDASAIGEVLGHPVRQIRARI
ncbi:hypothetical protein ACFXPN_32970 [Streptomyces griseorubiginosus]|uniref:hypothetical protein n=1 Tax=Streptomyces griseorubiginosus TaxID=67304 RepID=UPI0036A07B99